MFLLFASNTLRRPSSEKKGVSDTYACIQLRKSGHVTPRALVAFKQNATESNCFIYLVCIIYYVITGGKEYHLKAHTDSQLHPLPGWRLCLYCT